MIQLATALKRIKEEVSNIEAVRNENKKISKRSYLSSSSQGNLKHVMMRRLRSTANSLYLTSTTLMLRHQGASIHGSLCYSCWVSSGDGLKALVKISNPERHRDHFRALRTYFNKQYDLEVDESGINESRACFESYDPDLVADEGPQPSVHSLLRRRVTGGCIQSRGVPEYLTRPGCAYDSSVF